MGLTNVTGLFSRYFAVGFFLPAYFALLILWVAASRGLLPDGFEAYKGATQLAVLGGLALLAGLTLSGLNYGITRLFEGYPLEATRNRLLVRRLYDWLLAGQRSRFESLVAVRDGEDNDERDRTRAAWKLDRYFPDKSERLLPTAFGNAIRAFEGHAFKRYGLDGIGAFPRVEMLMPAAEREPLVDAKIEINVFMNAAVGAVVIGVALMVDAVVHTPMPLELSWLYLMPFVAAYALYRPMVNAAVRWGTEVRSSIDLHRLELYEKLGVRCPTSFSDERVVARQVNYLLLYGVAPPDTAWRPAEPPVGAGQAGGGGISAAPTPPPTATAPATPATAPAPKP